MKKYEYIIETKSWHYTIDHWKMFQQELNDMGLKGWELVQWHKNENFYTATYKRELL